MIVVGDSTLMDVPGADANSTEVMPVNPVPVIVTVFPPLVLPDAFAIPATAVIAGAAT